MHQSAVIRGLENYCFQSPSFVVISKAETDLVHYILGILYYASLKYSYQWCPWYKFRDEREKGPSASLLINT